MAYKQVEEVRFTADEYIKFSYFNNLYEKFIEKLDLKYYNNSSYSGKYLLAAIVACIEGQVYIDLQNKTWYFCNVEKNDILNNNSSNAYVLLNIYEFVKSNKDSFDFITKYFNLWHENKNSEFTYDNFHKKDLEENFQQLISIIEEDIKKAKNESDKHVNEVYSKLYDILTSSFSYSKEIKKIY